MRISREAILSLLGPALLLGGCHDAKITSYRIPKEDVASSSPGNPAATAASTPTAPSAETALQWVAPGQWKAKPASALRRASYEVAGGGGETADISVIVFPGTGGDDLANINRWRGQLQLPPIGDAALASQTQEFASAAGRFVIADLQGVSPASHTATRLVGAWLRQPGQTWFFKLMGPADLVGAQKEAFQSFLRSVTAADGRGGVSDLAPSVARSSNTNDLPRADLAASPAPFAPGATHPEAMEGAPIEVDHAASLRWQAPAGWKPGPASAMRKGSYLIGSGEGTATLAISAFPGDVGGVLANVNRWRGQMGLPPIAEGDLGTATSAFDSHGLHFVLADAAGDGPAGRQRIVAALIPWQGGTWFFKLTGADEAVAGTKSEFLDFLKTVEAP
jgi:hypothetical protein